MACSCTVCVNACKGRPGWFAPGEAEKAAALLGLTLIEFFRRYLGVDWWVGAPSTFILAPALTQMEPGSEYPSNPRGRCVFLGEDERCGIHAAKPFECAAYEHDDSDTAIDVRHEAVAMLWRDEKAKREVRDLLGREPVETDDYGDEADDLPI